MGTSINPVDALAELFGDDPHVDPQWMAEMRDYLEHPVDDEDPLKEWRVAYEKALDAPDAYCPGCGVGLVQMHREGCPEFARIKKEGEHAE